MLTLHTQKRGGGGRVAYMILYDGRDTPQRDDDDAQKHDTVECCALQTPPHLVAVHTRTMCCRFRFGFGQVLACPPVARLCECVVCECECVRMDAVAVYPMLTS